MNYCSSCFRNAKYFGEIFPRHDLLFVDGFYKIVDGHDTLIKFPEPPIADPWAGLTDEQVDAASEESEKQFCEYMKRVEALREYFVYHPQHGHEIVELCKQVGYDFNDGWLDYWLYDRAYGMIQKQDLTNHSESDKMPEYERPCDNSKGKECTASSEC